MKNSKQASKDGNKLVNKQTNKRSKRPLNKDDFDFVLTGVTKPLKKERGKRVSGKT